jgi:hypothetical protein
MTTCGPSHDLRRLWRGWATSRGKNLGHVWLLTILFVASIGLKFRAYSPHVMVFEWIGWRATSLERIACMRRFCVWILLSSNTSLYPQGTA